MPVTGILLGSKLQKSKKRCGASSLGKLLSPTRIRCFHTWTFFFSQFPNVQNQIAVNSITHDDERLLINYKIYFLFDKIPCGRAFQSFFIKPLKHYAVDKGQKTLDID